jgi:Uma2 family endonuclease
MPLDAYMALPEEKPYLQYWHGTVVQKAVPRRKHGRIEALTATELTLYSRVSGGDAVVEPHVWFDVPGDPGYLVPDVAYWAPGKAQGDDARMLPPTLAVEIRSPDETIASQREKCREMRRYGVDVCWLIDPERRAIEIFEGAADGKPHEVNSPLTSTLLPGLAIDPGQLFAVLDR